MVVSRNTISFGLFLASINMIAVGTDDSSDFQKSIPALVVWAVPGKDVELPCDTEPDVNDQVSMVLWFKDNVGIPVYSLDARDGPLSRAIHWAMSNDLGSRTNFLIGKGSVPSRLKINSVISSDQGIFRCRIDYNNSPTKNYKVNLTMIVQPSEPIIYDAQGREVFGVAGPFKEGYDLFLSCHVVGGRPRPKVTWWEGDQLLDSVMESVTPTLVINQYFTVNVSRSLYNTRLKCNASVLDTAPVLIKDIRIEVYLKPQDVKITLMTKVLASGRPQQYQCESWGSIPPAKITWLLEGEPIRNAAITASHNNNITQSVLTYRPTAIDNGKELTCRAENPRFPGSIIEHSVQLVVLYPPLVSIKIFSDYQIDNLKEGNKIQFACEVDSNPPPSQISWFHRHTIISQNESAGIVKSDRKLSLLNLTREQAGEYFCTARNSEGEIKSEAVNIHILYAPRCKEKYRSRTMGALRRDTVTVRCEVSANPSEDIRFSWTFNKSGDVLPLQANRVTSAKLSSHVEFTPVSEADFGTLACWASNGVGRQAEPCMTHIFPAKVPEPPKDCRLQNHSSGGLELTCVPSYDGGLQQHFMLEGTEQVQHSDHLSFNSIAITHSKDLPGFKMLGSQPTFILRQLQPGKSYQLSVFAINAKGRSDPPVVMPSVNIESSTARLTSTEINEKQIRVEDSDNPMTVILGILIAVALLIIAGIAIAAALVICKKRSVAVGNTLGSNYDSSLKIQGEIDKNEDGFIGELLVSKTRKLNNFSQEGKHETTSQQAKIKPFQILRDGLMPEAQKRSSFNHVRPNRHSMSFASMNNTESVKELEGGDRKYSMREAKFSSVNNLKNGEANKDCAPRQNTSEENGRRSHPRVTLGPEGQVMKCVITEVPAPEMLAATAAAKTS